MLPLLPFVLFLPTLVSFVIDEPGAVWVEFPGVFFHLALLLMISRLDAPDWAKAAGYGWITLDVLSGILTINAVPYEITWPVRLGGHVLAWVWIAMSSVFLRRHPVVTAVGVVTGVWLGGCSFVIAHAPDAILAPSSILIMVWFAMLAWVHRPGTAGEAGGGVAAGRQGSRPSSRAKSRYQY